MIAPVTSLFIFACFVIYLRDWIQVSLHSQLYDNNSQFWRQALEGLCYLGAPREHVDWSIDVGGSFGFEECSLCISGNHTAHYHDNSLHGVCDPKEESRLGLFANHVLCRNGRKRRRSTSGSSQAHLPATRVAASQARSRMAWTIMCQSKSLPFRRRRLVELVTLDSFLAVA